MVFILTLVFIYIGSVISKILFSLKTEKLLWVIPKDIFKEKYLLPFSQVFKKQLWENKKELNYLTVFEVFVSIAFALLSLEIYQSFGNPIYEIYDKILWASLLLSVVIVLTIISVEDIINLSLPKKIIKQLLFFVVVISIIVGLINITSNIIIGNNFLNIFVLGSFSSLVGFALLYFATKGIPFLEQDSKISEADAEINGTIGLMLGLSLSLDFIILFIIIGFLFAIIQILIKKKFKKQYVPLVPVATLSFLLTLVLELNLISSVL